MSGPILLFGMPRSGTTWVGKLFDSHPDTLYRHEPDSVRRLSLPPLPEVGTASRHREELRRFVADLPRMRSPEVVGKQPLFAKNYMSRSALFAYRASVLGAKAASRIRRHVPCPYRPTGGNRTDVRVVWKSIESVGRLGVCAVALPDARVVHLIRHPCGQVASVLRGRTSHRFDGEAADTDDSWRLNRLLATTAGARYRSTMGDPRTLSHVAQLAWIWVISNEKAMADTARLDNVLAVRYEDVCDDPVAMTQNMFAFAGLDWSSHTESFISASTGIRGTNTDYYSVFKRPRLAAEQWRSDLSPEDIESIMRILRRSPLATYYADDDRAVGAANAADPVLAP